MNDREVIFMEINAKVQNIKSDPAILQLIELLKANTSEFGLEKAQLYYNFPVLKDLDDDVAIAKLVLVSRQHGVIVFAPSNITKEFTTETLKDIDGTLDNLASLLYSRLIRNKALRKTRRDLLFFINTVIYAPFSESESEPCEVEATFIPTDASFKKWVSTIKYDPLEETVYKELIATFEGAKGLIKPKERQIPEDKANSKGGVAKGIELEIASFDEKQRLVDPASHPPP